MSICSGNYEFDDPDDTLLIDSMDTLTCTDIFQLVTHSYQGLNYHVNIVL